jgi:repressor LexA
MLAEQNIESWVRLPKAIARTGSQYFLLRVRGNSMNKATIARDTIEDGDLVLVRQQPSAKDGDIVVALIDGETTIKRLVRGAGYYVLKPQSTSKHRPIIVDKDFQVQGIVAKVLKQGSSIIS